MPVSPHQNVTRQAIARLSPAAKQRLGLWFCDTYLTCGASELVRDGTFTVSFARRRPTPRRMMVWVDYLAGRPTATIFLLRPGYGDFRIVQADPSVIETHFLRHKGEENS